MNDSQVKQQIQQLVSFIHQEAKDKAREIRAKAEEDFTIRKLSAVEAAREKIRAEYEKRTKQIEVNRKIAQSTETNAARLQILKARDNVLRESYEEAEKKLATLSSDQSKYSGLVASLILQGLLCLKDSEVVVRCRRSDLEIVKGSLLSVSEEYVAKTRDPVTVNVDESTFLSDSCIGGIVLLSQGGSIQVDNTFESRLDIAYNQNLPEIRKILFEAI